MHVVVVEWLSLKETGADRQGNQLTAEGKHDCCLVHETLLPNGARRRRIENSRNMVVVAVVAVVVEGKQ